MWLLPRDLKALPAERLAKLVRSAIEESRFTARVECGYVGKRFGVKVETVRLRRKKDYCGAHPGPCFVTFKKHRRASYLEGLDWVGYNAMLNDLLDRLNADVDAFSYNRECRDSGRYYVRKGTRRRVRYPYAFRLSGGNAHWIMGSSDNFEDHCGKEPPALDLGMEVSRTPGYPCYTRAEEAKCRALGGEEVTA